jgi:hypothetical protein
MYLIFDTYFGLVQFSKTFGVSYEEVSHVPTLVQAGYAV